MGPQHKDTNQRITAMMMELSEMGFDAGQLLLSYMEGGQTFGKAICSGNYYARRGLAEEFLRDGRDGDLSNEIAKKLNPPDDSDNWKEKA